MEILFTNQSHIRDCLRSRVFKLLSQLLFCSGLILGNRRGRSAVPRGMQEWVRGRKGKRSFQSACIIVWVTLATVSRNIVSLFKATAADLTRELVGALSIVFPHVPIQRGFLSTGEATHFTLQRLLSGVYPAVDDQVTAGSKRPSTELTDIVSLITVQLFMLLQMLLKVKGLSAGGMRAGEGLLMQMLIFDMMI